MLLLIRYSNSDLLDVFHIWLYMRANMRKYKVANPKRFYKNVCYYKK